MRRWLIGVSSVLIACSSSGAGDDGEGPATTISVKPSAGGAIDLVAFRETRATTWQALTADATGTYTFQASAPYWVSVVCHDTYPDATSRSVHQIGHTLSDPTTIDGAFCTSPQLTYTVSGTIGASGSVMIADNDVFTNGQGAFQANVAPGTYTLYAENRERVLIARDLAITTDVTLPALDIATQGTALVDASFTVTNAASGSDVQLSLGAMIAPSGPQATSVLPFYIGSPMTAKVLPDAGLTSADYQSVSFREYHVNGNHTQTRAYRKPFKIGDSTSFTLPDPIEGLQWSTTADPVSVQWSSLPDMPFDLYVDGVAPDGSGSDRTLAVSVTQSFLEITRITHVEFETALPGFQTSWGVDRTQLSALNVYGQIADDASTSPVISVSDEQQLISFD